MSLIDIKVPNIGDFAEVGVIELLVNAGDTVAVDQSLITVESDKASMEIPSSHAGVVKEIKVKVGDKVAEGTVLIKVEAAGAAAAAPAPAAAAAVVASRFPSMMKSEPKRAVKVSMPLTKKWPCASVIAILKSKPSMRNFSAAPSVKKQRNCSIPIRGRGK